MSDSLAEKLREEKLRSRQLRKEHIARWAVESKKLRQLKETEGAMIKQWQDMQKQAEVSKSSDSSYSTEILWDVSERP